MLGQPMYFLTPDVVGVHLTGALARRRHRDRSRAHGHRDAARGEGGRQVRRVLRRRRRRLSPSPTARRSATWRPSTARRCGFFPVDDKTVAYLEGTGRTDEEVDCGQGLLQGAGHCTACRRRVRSTTARRPGARSRHGEHRRSPGRSARRIASRSAEREGEVRRALRETGRRRRVRQGAATLYASAAPTGKAGIDLGHGDVLIAAITSCTNTSNPGVLLAAGLLAKKAVARGLTVKTHVKTSLAPGSRVVTEYLTKRACCPIWSSSASQWPPTAARPASATPARSIRRSTRRSRRTISCAPRCSRATATSRRASTRTSGRTSSLRPPLVVAYAITGTMLVDLMTEPLGKGSKGEDVWIGDIWPTSEEIHDCMKYAMDPETFRSLYGGLADANPMWNAVSASTGQVYNWDPKSTYIAEPPFFEGFGMQARAHERHPRCARARDLRRLDHHRPHQPGRLDQADLAGGDLPPGARRGRRRFQLLRRAARQPRGDDARHVRQRAHQAT